jgi:hypothetical protein
MSSIEWNHTYSFLETYIKYTKGELKLDPDFQRDLCWSKTNQNDFIDSILNGFKNNNQPLIRHIDLWKNNNKLHVIDGQQRLHTLFDFYEEEGYFKERSFNKLDENTKKKFNGMTIHYFLIKGTLEEAESYFITLNKGMPLRPQEIRRNMQSPVRNISKNIIKHKLFDKESGYVTKNRRFEHHNIADCIVLFFHKNSYNMRKDILKNLYDTAPENFPKKTIEEISNFLDYVYRGVISLDSKVSLQRHLARRDFAILHYLFTSYKKRNPAEKFIKAYFDITIRIKKLNSKEISDPKNLYGQLRKNFASGSTNSERIKDICKIYKVLMDEALL